MNFFRKYKMILLALGFILITLVIGYAIYSFFFRAMMLPPVVTQPTATGTTGALPVATTGQGQTQTPGSVPPGQPGVLPEGKPSPVANGGLTQTDELTPSPNISPTLTSNGTDVQYYDQSDGKFYQVDKNGNITPLTDKIFHNVEQVTWSPDKNKAIIEYPDGANIVYNFSTDDQVTLPTHWQDFNFSPDSSSLVLKSMGLDPDNRWLAVANTDGSKARPIEALGDKDGTVYPSWSPNQQTIAMFTEGIDFNRQEVFFVGLNNENFKSMVVEGRGFQSKWAPAGDRLLYSVYSSDNNMKPLLWIANAQGENIGTGRKSLGVETWADKCTFAGVNDVYCAVPQNLPEGAGLMPELAKSSADQLYKIDTSTGLKKLIAIPNGSYSMNNLMVTENGFYLYFTDANTKRLNKIKLR